MAGAPQTGVVPNSSGDEGIPGAIAINSGLQSICPESAIPDDTFDVSLYLRTFSVREYPRGLPLAFSFD